MTSRLTISIDAMGGDHAPGIIVEGAAVFLRRHPEVHLLLFGDKDQLEPLLAASPRVAAASEICHTSEAVSMEDKPGQVLRKGRQTSMWLAIDAVKQGRAQAVVSAGNTGALMALAKFQLRTMAGIDRPAIGTVWPKKEGQCVAAASEICHTSEAVSMEDKPGQVLRKGRQTSMWLAIDAVKQGRAQAVVSAGNTGALMALAKFQLRTMAGIDRPAIGTVWPKKEGQCVVLDVGANVEASAKQLVDFAILGWAFAGAVLHKADPAVAILNIGSEELKGPDPLRAAAAILRDERLGLNFVGFVEGDDLTTGSADVVVTDGFTGNVALKTAEGTARMLAHYMRDAFTGSVISRLGALIAAKAFKKLKIMMDPSRVNGGVFLGLNGIVVKSHGGTDSTGFASALDLAADLAGSEFSSKISESLVRLNAKLNQDQSADNLQTSDEGENINTGVTAQRI